MLSGGEAPFKKHLTLEMQNKLQNLMKGSPDNAPSPLLALTGAKSAGANGFSPSILGPFCLLSTTLRNMSAMKLQIDSEDQRADEDIMGLSLHLVRNGVEQRDPCRSKILARLKRQAGIWRLTTVNRECLTAGGRSANPGKILVGAALAAAAGAT